MSGCLSPPSEFQFASCLCVTVQAIPALPKWAVSYIVPPNLEQHHSCIGRTPQFQDLARDDKADDSSGAGSDSKKHLTSTRC